MKKTVRIVMFLFLVGMTFTLKSQNMTQQDKNSYALGANVGEQFKSQDLEISNSELFLQGFLDAFKGTNKFSVEEMQSCFDDIQRRMEVKQNAGMEIEKEKGRKFLEANKQRAGVKETPSGLQYEVIVMGDGSKPEATDRVKVHYTGKTLDGEVFDSSVARGEPVTFGLNQVIRGWTEGLQLMPVGSKYMLYIPSDLAYGDRGQGGVIKPGATLIFEVELLDIPK
jgi:FKBP-type peptidyl-prolyl cis-trans isomerase FklB